LIYPASYLGKGAAHAVKLMEAHPQIAFSSTDRDEVVKKPQEPQFRDLVFDIGEQNWDPAAFRARKFRMLIP
jgi:hypothetical protein